jgi:hypothetical protein
MRRYPRAALGRTPRLLPIQAAAQEAGGSDCVDPEGNAIEFVEPCMD